MNPKLVYDVGMHNGDDTAHYLEQGYSVVAIEANPVLTEQARRRFAAQIERGQLIVLNVGIADRPGVMSFWVNRTNSEWSSFDYRSAVKFSRDVERIEAPTVRFEQVLAEYGVPYFLKIDIEGYDLLCLAALDRDDLPQYVSVEAHSIDRLFELRRLGYDAFKCINQAWHNAPERGVKEVCAAANGTPPRASTLPKSWPATLRTIKRKTLALPLLSTAHQVLRRARNRPPARGWRESLPQGNFPIGSSGPFGEQTYGVWREFEEVAFDWLSLKLGHADRSRLTQPGWFDFHATRRNGRSTNDIS